LRKKAFTFFLVNQKVYDLKIHVEIIITLPLTTAKLNTWVKHKLQRLNLKKMAP